MADTDIQKQGYSSSLNLLKPIELVLKLVQKVIDILVCQLERMVGFLTDLKLPGGLSLAPEPGSFRANLQEQVFNTLDIPRLVLGFQLNILKTVRRILFDVLGWTAGFIRKPATAVSGVTDKLQPYLPIQLPKFDIDVDDVDCTKLDVPYSLSDLINKLQSFLPGNMSKPLENLLSLLPGNLGSGKEIEPGKSNKDLLELLEKERQKHLMELAKLKEGDPNGTSTKEILERQQKEYDNMKQDLQLKLEKEIEAHKTDVEQLKLKCEKEKIEADEKLTLATTDCTKQKQDLQKKIDKLTETSKDDKVLCEEKVIKLQNDCKKQQQELWDKLELERANGEELEKLKIEHEKQKTLFFEKTSKEREAHQAELDEVLALRAKEKAKSDEKVALITKDFTTQKQALLDQIDKERKECADRIEKLTLENNSDKTASDDNLTKTNQALEAEKAELQAQIAKEREQYKKEIDDLAAKSRDEKTSSDARIDQLTQDLAKQKQDLLGDVNKEKLSTQEQIDKALAAQKIALDKECADIKIQLAALQTKYDALEKTAKDKGFFGTINETLSKPAEGLDKVTKPLQDVNFGNVFRP